MDDPDGKGCGTSWVKGLVPALAAGALLRLWYLHDLSAHPSFGHPIVDARTYDTMARSLLEGAWGGAFFRPPLYPLFLSRLYALFGPGQVAVAVVQFALGLAAIIPVYLLGARWFGRRAAALAAWISALYPLRIFFEGEILAVALFGFLLAWGLWLFWTGWESGSPPGLAAAGALLAAAALTRPNLLIALPFVLAAGVLTWKRPAGETARSLLWFLLAFAVTLSPATLHNWRAENRLIPVAANGGVNFYFGNRTGSSGGTPLPPGLIWQDAVQEPIRLGLRSLSDQDRYWWRRAASEAGENPSRWLLHLGRKAALFANAFELSNNKNLDYFTALSPPTRYYRFWYGALLAFAAAAVVLLPRVPGTAALLSFVGGYCVAVSLFFVTARYRLPAVPFIALLASAGIFSTAGAARGREWKRLAAALALAAVVALAVFPRWRAAPYGGTRPEFQMGQIFLSRGDLRRAGEHLDRAFAERPHSPDVSNSLGAVRFFSGQMEEAERHYLTALEAGEYSEVYYNLGVVYEKMGPSRLDDAAAAYRRSLERNPLEARAAANLRQLVGDSLPPSPGAEQQGGPR